MKKRRKSFVRSGHGAGKGTPHVEMPPGDEMSAPVPVAVTTVPLVFRQDGRIADSETARELGRRGGTATAKRVRLIDSLGLVAAVEGSVFGPYRTAAEGFVAHHLDELARLAGGKVGSGPSTMVSSAALQLAASRFAFDKAAETGDVAMMRTGSQLATDSRQNLLAAYELAVREAEGRARSDGDDPFFAAVGSTK